MWEHLVDGEGGVPWQFINKRRKMLIYFEDILGDTSSYTKFGRLFGCTDRNSAQSSDELIDHKCCGS